ncbi:MAG: hypothetical protein HPY79_02115 [Bacteroidales bacterium]|nr:hypothetical protein [Bacteroidales bacterium]
MKSISLIFVFCLVFYFSYSQQANQKTSFSALMFGDYFYNVQRDSLATSLNFASLNDAKNINGFRYRRIYLTYDYPFDQRISTKITLESDQEANTSNGKFGFFVKDAYIKWDSSFFKSSLIVGIQSPPTYLYSEKWWAHRFLEKTINNLRKTEESKDFGLSLNGNIFTNRWFYHVMVGNNSGNKTEIDRFKSIYSLIGYKPNNHFLFTLSYSHHFQIRTLDFYDTSSTIQLLNKDISLLNFFVGYQIKDKLYFGLEAFYERFNHAFNSGSSLDNYDSYGTCFFVNYKLNNTFSFTGRIDYYEPNHHILATHDYRIFSLLATNVQVYKSIIISPNIIAEFYEKQSNGTKIKPSITPRITFYWKY